MVCGQPSSPFIVEVVAGPVIDHEKNLAPRSTNDVPQERQERLCIEDGREFVVKAWLQLQGNRCSNRFSIPRTPHDHPAMIGAR
jgi:hypothetical protein